MLQDSFSWEELVGGNEKSKDYPSFFDFASQPTKYFATDVSFSIQKQYTCSDRFKVKLSCRRWGDALTAEFTTIQTYSPEKISSAWRYSFRHC